LNTSKSPLCREMLLQAYPQQQRDRPRPALQFKKLDSILSPFVSQAASRGLVSLIYHSRDQNFWLFLWNFAPPNHRYFYIF
jgi:hypothetical protein